MKFELKYGRTELGEKRGAPERIKEFVRMIGSYALIAQRAGSVNKQQDDRQRRYYTFYPSPVESETKNEI